MGVASLKMQIACICLHNQFESSNLSVEQVLPNSSEIYASQNSHLCICITSKVYSPANSGIVALCPVFCFKIQQKCSNFPIERQIYSTMLDFEVYRPLVVVGEK